MVTKYERGRAAEYRVQHELEAEGYVTVRAAGSHGPADVIAWNDHHVRFIQVKTFVKRMSDYAKDVQKLKNLVLLPNATRELWIRQKGKPGWIEKRIITDG